jgi:Lipocalin-like domain
MINGRKFITGLFLLTGSVFLGQTSTSLTDKLFGTWYLAHTPTSADSLVYVRTSKIPNNWGHRIEFNSNNNFLDAYSAPCGNDDQIHSNIGIWQLSGQTITTSIPISVDNGREHFIGLLTSDELVLIRTN